MPSIPCGARVRSDAMMIRQLLETRFLYATRAELRKTLCIDGSRLYRAILHLERTGVLLAEHRGRLAIAERLY